MDEKQREPNREQPGEVSPDPEERAFSGHPDHPPATPDHSLEGNQELLRQGGDAEDGAGAAGGAD